MIIMVSENIAVLLLLTKQMGLIPPEERNTGEGLKAVTPYGLNTID